MWEIAARAGCTTKWLGGDSKANTDYGWFSDNSNGKIHEVGTTPKCNDWGIYDVLGNMWEYTRDTVNSKNLADVQPNGLVPFNAGGANLSYRGAAYGYKTTEVWTRLASRAVNTKGSTSPTWGIRVSYFPQ